MIGSAARKKQTRRRTCRGFPDRPCYAPLTGGNAQKYCPPCAEEAARRRKPGDDSTYYRKHRQQILAGRKRKYQAKVAAEQLVQRRYADYKDLKELVFPEQKMLSFEEWLAAGFADKPSPLEIVNRSAAG